MTYKFNGPSASGTGLYFQSGNEDLPMDKLQSFWPCRGIGTGTSPDLIGNAPLSATGTPFWEPSNPCGGSLGAADYAAAATTFLGTTGDATEWSPIDRNKKWWLSFWFYPRTGVTPIADAIINTSIWGGNGFFVSTGIVNSAPGTMEFVCGNGSGGWLTGCDAGSWNAGAWNFAVVGHDGGSGSGTSFASLNGAAVVTQSSQTLTSGGSAYPLMIGGGGIFAVSQTLDGMIADVGLWVDVSANATSDEIAALYNGGNGNTLIGG